MKYHETILGHHVELDEESVNVFNGDSSPNATTCLTTGKICANRAFFDLPYRLKRSIIAHEEGHQMYHRAGSQLDMLLTAAMSGYSLTDWIAMREIEADVYAMRRIGVKEWARTMVELLGICYPDDPAKAKERLTDRTSAAFLAFIVEKGLDQ